MGYHRLVSIRLGDNAVVPRNLTALAGKKFSKTKRYQDGKQNSCIKYLANYKDKYCIMSFKSTGYKRVQNYMPISNLNRFVIISQENNVITIVSFRHPCGV
jgi:hypothetical protein